MTVMFWNQAICREQPGQVHRAAGTHRSISAIPHPGPGDALDHQPHVAEVSPSARAFCSSLGDSNSAGPSRGPSTWWMLEVSDI